MPQFSFIYSIPYVIFFLLLYVNALPINKLNSNSTYSWSFNNWLQIFTIVVILLVFIGFRGFIYTDWISYYPFFNTAPTLFDGWQTIVVFFHSPWENGFLLYTILLRTVSANYFLFQLVSFVINLLVLFCFFKRVIPKYIAFGFLFYILFSGLVIEINLLRNSKSIMLFLISLKYLEEKKFIKYTIINILGSLFHITALLYIPLFFLLHKKYPKSVIMLFFAIGNILFIFQIEWFKLVLLQISTFIPGRLGILMNTYLDSYTFTSAYGISIGSLERFFSFILFFSLSGKLCKINKNNLIYINAYYLYAFIFLYFSEMRIIPERIGILLIFSYWILYPQIYSFLEKKSKYIFLMLLLIYGILKMGVGHKAIITRYDNILLPHKSFSERVIILNEHLRYLNL